MASRKTATGRAATTAAGKRRTATGSTSTNTNHRRKDTKLGLIPARPARDPKKKHGPLIEVRRIHRRDLKRAWEFLKLSFREVNAETVEYQRPISKSRFEEIYDDEGVEQLLFEVDGQIVAYAECSHEVVGSDNWINPRYFEKRDMRPLFIDELAVHPDWHGRGVGSFVLEQLHHLAKVNGLTHLVLEVAENNETALNWYRKREFRKLDAAIFMAASVETEDELLPPRELPPSRGGDEETPDASSDDAS
jgi:ribosomal protein S18 acetylase RimI-like enzyme